MAYPDVEEAVRDYLEDQNEFIIGHSNDTLPIYLNEFPTDGEPVSVMVRESSGFAWLDLPIVQPQIQIWSRALTPENAKLILSRIFELLDKFGPAALNDDVYCYNMRLNTNRQRMDDPGNAKLAQYFMIFDMIVREC